MDEDKDALLRDSKDKFIEAGYWPNEVMWVCWQKGWCLGFDAALSQPRYGICEECGMDLVLCCQICAAPQKAAGQIADGQASQKLTDNALASGETGSSVPAAPHRESLRAKILADPDIDSDAGIPGYSAPAAPDAGLSKERLLELSSMPPALMELAKDQFGSHFLQFEIWVGKTIRQALQESRRALDEDTVRVPREHLQDALNYIKHCGANAVMRGQPHPQQQIVDWLEAPLSAAQKEEKP